jgi:hypothetical protein
MRWTDLIHQTLSIVKIFLLPHMPSSFFPGTLLSCLSKAVGRKVDSGGAEMVELSLIRDSFFYDEPCWKSITGELR